MQVKAGATISVSVPDMTQAALSAERVPWVVLPRLSVYHDSKMVKMQAMRHDRNRREFVAEYKFESRGAYVLIVEGETVTTKVTESKLFMVGDAITVVAGENIGSPSRPHVFITIRDGKAYECG